MSCGPSAVATNDQLKVDVKKGLRPAQRRAIESLLGTEGMSFYPEGTTTHVLFYRGPKLPRLNLSQLAQDKALKEKHIFDGESTVITPNPKGYIDVCRIRQSDTEIKLYLTCHTDEGRDHEQTALELRNLLLRHLALD